MLNRPDRWLGLNKRSLKTTGVCASASFVFAAFFQGVGIDFWLATGFFMGLGGYFVSEWLYGNESDWHNLKLESIVVKYRRVNPVLSGRGFKMFEGFDSNSIYTASGEEFFAFELQTVEISEVQEIGFSILRSMPQGLSVKFIRGNIPYSNEFISKNRPLLEKIGLVKPLFYIVFSRDSLVSKSSEKKAFLSGLSPLLRRLSPEEMNRFNSLILNPEFGSEGHSSVHSVAGGRSWVYPNRCYGAASVIELPDDVNDRFHEFLNVLGSSIGFCSVHFEKSFGGKSLALAWRTYKTLQSKTIQVFGAGGAKAQQLNKQLEDVEKGYAIDLKMYLSVVVYGHPDDVSAKLSSLQSVSSSGKSPIISIDNGYIKECVEGLLIGRSGFNPLRQQVVRSVEEASFYLPAPSYYKDGTGRETLVFRTIDNHPFFIDHANLEVTPITLMVGKSGFGKSTLLSLMMDAHLMQGTLLGRPVALACGDVGESAGWLVENELADLVFNLSRKGGADYKPLPIHPLAVFLGDAVDSAPMKAQARVLLNSFLEVVEETSTSKAVVEKALEALVSSKKVRLIDFVGCLEGAVEIYSRKVPDGALPEFKGIWFERVTSLKRFAKGGIYGGLFDPDTVKLSSLDGVNVFYYNLEEEDFLNKDLVRPFLRLCYLTSQALSARFKAGGDDSRDTLLVMDEFDRQADYFPDSTLKSMKDQSRKYGNIPVLGIQSFDYLSRSGDDGDKDDTIYEGVGRTFFYQIGQEKVYSKVSAIFDEPYRGDLGPKLRQMADISERIMKSKEAGWKDGRPVGFFDTDKRISTLHVDVELNTLWRITTMPGGRAVRAAVMERLGLNLNAASSRLALAEIDIPVGTPSAADIEEVIRKVSRK